MEEISKANLPDLTEGMSSPEDIKLSKLNLGELSVWVDKYNRQFSLGALMGRAMIGAAHQQEDMGTESEEVGPVVLRSSEREQQLSFSEIQRRTQELLNQSGLALEPVKSGGVIMSSSLEADDYPTELRINLSDGKRFARYLEVLDGSKILDSQREGLVVVANSLTKQLKTHYGLENAEDDKVLEFFGSASRIIKEYERLDKQGGGGLGDSTVELKRLIDIAKQGYLREELLVEKEGLLSEVGGQNFGPSKWHTDTAESTYKNYWNRALDALHVLEKNPKAKNLLTRARENLKASIEYAKKDITEKLKDGNKSYFEWWNNEAFKFLNTVRSELERIGYGD